MKMKTLVVQLTLAGALFFLGQNNTALASPVGVLNLANCSGGGAIVDLFTITWMPTGTVPGTGCIDTGLGTSVVYSGGTLGAGVAGNIKNQPSAPDHFMDFPAVSPVLDFLLLGFGPGDANTVCTGLAIGASCSVAAGSPFVLTNLGGGQSSVELEAHGTVSDTAGSSNWVGAFTTQLNLTPDTIQSVILGGGSISSTYSAQVVATAPEPLSMFLIGGGLIALGFVRRYGKVRT